MTETENTDVVTEAVAPAAEETPQANHEEQHQEAPEQAGQSDKEMNWAAMRERQDALEQKLYERDEMINALQGQVGAYNPPEPEVQEVDELDSLSNDEWLTKEQSTKLARRQAEEAVKAALETERQRRAQEELPDRIKREHPDFDQVVSKENVEYLKANKPYLAQTLAATTDPYAQAKSAYDAIKAFCPSAQVSQDKQKAEKNALRPGTLDAAGPARTQDYDPKRINDQVKKQMWKEMQEAARG